jgi:hypothetical protein
MKLFHGLLLMVLSAGVAPQKLIFGIQPYETEGNQDTAIYHTQHCPEKALNSYFLED